MKLLFAAAITLLLIAQSATAHEIPTHQNITRIAVDYLRAQSAKFACAANLNANLQVGTEHEDDNFGLLLLPLGRYYFHFLPLLNGGGNLADCASPDWGLGGLVMEGG